jgi:uncharacterized membrane-anchored protein YjiN (DUF445 family)
VTAHRDQKAASEPLAPLRRLIFMRWVASGLLALMALVFVACSLGLRRWPQLAYVRAFAEAGMIGACADWFAVTALFRRPLGLPIPHTGLIPRKKEQIGAALGGFIAENFLTEAVLEARLRQLELARWGAAWLREPANVASLGARLTSLMQELLRLVSPQARRALTAAVASDLARNLPAATLAASGLRALWVEGRSQALLDQLLEVVAGALADNETLIRDQIAGRTFRWAPQWLDRKIADKILKVLAEVVEDMRRPDHPWRAQVSVAVERFIERLDADPALRERIERFKRDLLEHPLILDRLDGLWSRAEEWINPQTPEGRQALADMASRLLRAGGDWLETHDDARDILNGWARLAARDVIAPRRHQIGAFVAEVVAAWDTRSIVDKLELQVGPDLQYIRINGTLVGGCVGLAIFCLARWLSL